MKRPFLVIGGTMLFTLFLMNGANKMAMSVAFVAALIAFFISILHRGARKEKTLPTAFFCVLFSLVLLSSAEAKTAQKLENWQGKTVLIRATLKDLPYSKNGKFYYLLSADYMDGQKVRETIRLTLDQPLELAPTETLYAKLSLSALYTEKTELRRVQYDKANDCVLGAGKLENYHVKATVSPSLRSHILQFRLRCKAIAEAAVPQEEGQMILAMTLGVKTGLSKILQQQFRTAGVSHLLVVSGLHLTTICGFLFLLLQKLQLHRRKRAALGILCTLFLTVLMGGAPSVCRAALMLILCFAADLFSREADGLNSLGVALFVMLFLNPFAAHSLTLLLSSLSTIGILLFAKRIETFCLHTFCPHPKHKVLYKFLDFCFCMFSVTFSVTLTTIPIQILELGNFSLYALLSNFLLVFLAGFLMIFAMLGIAFGLLSLPALSLCSFLPSVYLAKYMLWVTGWISQLPFAVLPIGNKLSMGIFIAFCLCMAVYFLFGTPKAKTIKQLTAIFAACFALGTIVLTCYRENQMTVRPIATGENMSVVIHYQGKNILLCDAKASFSDQEICAILYTYGAHKIDVAVLPTENPKALTELREVSEQYPIDTLYYSPKHTPKTLPKSQTAKAIRREVVSVGKKGTLLLCEKNSVRYSEFWLGQAVCRMAYSATDFEGTPATLFLTAKPLAQYGFAPEQYRAICLGDKNQEIDLIALQNPNTYLFSENPDLEFLLSKQERIHQNVWR